MKPKDWDRIAEDFYGEIISPIKNAKINPLLTDLKKFANKNYHVLDAGCGLGGLSQLLSSQYGKVTGIDFSPKMIEIATKKNKTSNVSFAQADMRNLIEYHNTCDMVVSINSLLMTKLDELNASFDQLFKTLKPGGKLLAIVPSMEVFLYQAMLLIHRNMHEGDSQVVALQKTKQFISSQEHDFLLGTITFDGDSEKCFYDFEIKHRLEKAGFANIELSKVLYSWQEYKKAGQESFVGEPLPWDWYVVAHKPSKQTNS